MDLPGKSGGTFWLVASDEKGGPDGKKGERLVFADEFKREAVWLKETSGRTVVQVANDLGIGPSTLTRWKRHCREAGPRSWPQCIQYQ